MQWLKYRPGWVLFAVSILVLFLVSAPYAGDQVGQLEAILTGKTSYWIKPFNDHLEMLETPKVKAKKTIYCPPDTTEYECPMPDDESGLVEVIPAQRKLCPGGWDFIKRKCRGKK